MVKQIMSGSNLQRKGPLSSRQEAKREARARVQVFPSRENLSDLTSSSVALLLKVSITFYPELWTTD